MTDDSTSAANPIKYWIPDQVGDDNTNRTAWDGDLPLGLIKIPIIYFNQFNNFDNYFFNLMSRDYRKNM